MSQSFYDQEMPASIIEEGGESMNPWAVFVFPKTSPVFSGHFPGNPVLPAVIQMPAVRLVAERALGRPLLPKSQERSRFTNVVRPEEKLRIGLVINPEGDDFRVEFSLRCNDEAVARGEIVYKEGE